MFTDLAVIDWIALVFAAILLAAAAAAAVIAYATSQRPKQRLVSSGRSTSPQHAATSRDQAMRTALLTDTSQDRPQAAMAHADHVSSPHALDADAKVAARAAKLRRRPVAEQPFAEQSKAEKWGAENTKGAVATIVGEAPAHSMQPVPETPVARTGVATVTFDRAKGFKARTPGFFDDPIGRHELRYWDGQSWTEYVKEHGERFTDPL